MKTTYYTSTAWNSSAMAAGFDGSLDKGARTAVTRRPERSGRSLGGDNVIDMAAWRVENLEKSRGRAEGPVWEWDEPDRAAAKPARRVRKSHRLLLLAELASTISVAAALAALAIRVLVF